MKTVADYQQEIIDLSTALQDYPESNPLRKKLDYRLAKWVSMLDICVLVARNEQTPWTEDELGFPTKPMYRKEISGKNQVGDYQFFIKDYNAWGGLLTERKGGRDGPEDLYGTLMKSDNRARFYREISRYEQDPRFDSMIVIVECDLIDFLRYTPKFNGQKYNHDHTGASVASRRGAIASLHARGIPVMWAANRRQATAMYGYLVRQWCIKNFGKIVGVVE